MKSLSKESDDSILHEDLKHLSVLHPDNDRFTQWLLAVFTHDWCIWAFQYDSILKSKQVMDRKLQNEEKLKDSLLSGQIDYTRAQERNLMFYYRPRT